MSRLLRSFPRPSASEWLCLAGGLFLTIRYAWLLDDAFVYFRYADNLLHLGFGLVYNAGEYVEGYTSPLWMLAVIGLRAAGLDYWLLVRLVGALSFVIFWGLLVLLNRRMSPPGAPVLNLPLCYLSANYAVLCYFTSGVEAPLVQVAAVVYALFVLRPEHPVLQVLVAATPLLRPELAVPAGAAWIWAWWKSGRLPRRMALAGAGFALGWLVFRVLYYADLFPNTYYLKNASDPAQGWIYLLDTARPYWLPLFLTLMAAALALGQHRARRRDLTFPALYGVRLAMLGLAALVAAWVLRIGGDPRHYRYLAFPFCLAVMAGAGSAERLLDTLSWRWARVAAPVAALLVIGAALSFRPAQLLDHPLAASVRYGMVNRINDAAYHRDRIRRPAWGSGQPFEQRQRYAGFVPAAAEAPYNGVYSDGWCAHHYERYDQRIVHALGLTDALLARTEVPSRRPGHKVRLMPLARDLAALLRASGNGAPTPRMFELAVEEGRAPAWIAANLESIRSIQAKVTNSHRPLENLSLAFTFPAAVQPGPRRRLSPAAVQEQPGPGAEQPQQ